MARKQKENNQQFEKEMPYRRQHGCDGCHCDVPTQKFEGYCGDTLWICRMCFQELVKNGIPSQKLPKEDSK